MVVNVFCICACANSFRNHIANTCTQDRLKNTDIHIHIVTMMLTRERERENLCVNYAFHFFCPFLYIRLPLNGTQSISRKIYHKNKSSLILAIHRTVSFLLRSCYAKDTNSNSSVVPHFGLSLSSLFGLFSLTQSSVIYSSFLYALSQNCIVFGQRSDEINWLRL